MLLSYGPRDIVALPIIPSQLNQWSAMMIRVQQGFNFSAAAHQNSLLAPPRWKNKEGVPGEFWHLFFWKSHTSNGPPSPVPSSHGGKRMPLLGSPQATPERNATGLACHSPWWEISPQNQLLVQRGFQKWSQNIAIMAHSHPISSFLKAI